MRHFHLKRIDSTNRYMKDHLGSFNENTLVTTDFQTAGKGRRERTWQSEPGKNFLGSFLIRQNINHFQALMIATLTVRQTLLDLEIPVTVKLPNDLYSTDGKICGILIERLHEKERTIIGIGLNVNEDFKGRKDLNATSIRTITKEEHSIFKLKDNLIKNMKYYLEQPYATLFDTYKKAVFERPVYAFFNGTLVEITELNQKFECFFEDRWVPCTELNFDAPASN